jgi:hypothetical protein
MHPRTKPRSHTRDRQVGPASDRPHLAVTQDRGGGGLSRSRRRRGLRPNGVHHCALRPKADPTVHRVRSNEHRGQLASTHGGTWLGSPAQACLRPWRGAGSNVRAPGGQKGLNACENRARRGAEMRGSRSGDLRRARSELRRVILVEGRLTTGG